MEAARGDISEPREGTGQDWECLQEEALSWSGVELPSAQANAQQIQEVAERITATEQSRAQRPLTKMPDDGLSIYFRDMGSTEVLAPEEERLLAQCIELGNEADERHEAPQDHSEVIPDANAELQRHQANGRHAYELFVRANLRLVVYLASYARNHHAPDMELEDLIQYGNRGLMRAVEKFDWRRGYKFSTYATWWVRQAIQRGVAESRYGIRRPAQEYDRQQKVTAARKRLLNELDREPTMAELALATDIDETKVARAIACNHKIVSLQQPISSETDGFDLEMLLPDADDTPEDTVVQNAEREASHDLIEEVMSVLDGRERLIIRVRFGLDEWPERPTLESIGRTLGCSREYVRKLEKEALGKLRSQLQERGLDNSDH